jgi:hypothetical protein
LSAWAWRCDEFDFVVLLGRMHGTGENGGMGSLGQGAFLAWLKNSIRNK